METILRVDNLRKSYGKIEALKGVSFEVKKGEVFALIGPNGAGKSTTLRIIATLLTSYEGNVLFMGKNLKENPDFVRENISYLPEEGWSI
nr:ATP-binding cassette domain-containing protein [Dictyoglomus thermophilum]